MSFRGLWIIAKDKKEEGHLLFSRKYPTVERRYQLIHDTTSDDGFPDDKQLVKSLFSKLELGRKSDEFIEEHDGCKHCKAKPVYEIDVNGECLWPFIVIQKFNLVLACLGLLEHKSFDNKTPLVEIPAISIGYALLHNIGEFLENSPGNNVQVSPEVDELGNILKIIMPFGTPTDTNLNTVKNYIAGKDAGWIPKYKLSAWRPVAHKGRNQLHFNIQEKVNAAIYNRPEKTVYKDMCHMHGTISCKADIEGVPEVSVNLVSKPNIHLVFHPCLQSNDLAANARQDSFGKVSPKYYSSVEQDPVSRNVRFIPPVEQFPLCHFNAHSHLPVKGIYSLKFENHATQLQIKLQLNDGIKNAFEYFEVHIPFFHSGPILKLDYLNSAGTVLISPEKRRLVWSLGQKLPKSLQVTLNASVLLGDHVPTEKSNFKEDLFCKGLSTYIQIYFKMANFSLSDIVLDPKSMHITPSSSTKIHIAKELVSSDYKIWNVYGDAIVAFPSTI